MWQIFNTPWILLAVLTGLATLAWIYVRARKDSNDDWDGVA